VALVTGATSGLGRRFARLPGDCGAQVTVAGRRVKRLDQVVKEIRKAGGSAFPLTLDNNAGIPDAQRAHKMSHELIDAVLERSDPVGAGCRRDHTPARRSPPSTT
jgi:NADP-dependent 3-hydroxy acid dehydrogenase YdfG